MECSCKFQNPEGIKFCGKCGKNLERECSKCRYMNPSNFQFCGKCGSSIIEGFDTAKDAPPTESERKHVTILFSDLCFPQLHH